MEVPSSLRWAGIGWEGLHLWLCSPLVPLLLFFYSAVSTRPLEVLWVPGSWWSRKELGSLTPGPPFPRGQDAFVNLVVWKEALSCPHCKAGLGCCPWETTLISSAPPFPCLLSPWRALGFSLGPDPNGRGSIVAARAEPSPAWGGCSSLAGNCWGESQSQGHVSPPMTPFQTGMVSDDWGV